MRHDPRCIRRSFGIQVARLAGLPEGVVGRAKEILTLEQGDSAPLPSSDYPRESIVPEGECEIPAPSEVRVKKDKSIQKKTDPSTGNYFEFLSFALF